MWSINNEWIEDPNITEDIKEFIEYFNMESFSRIYLLTESGKVYIINADNLPYEYDAGTITEIYYSGSEVEVDKANFFDYLKYSNISGDQTFTTISIINLATTDCSSISSIIAKNSSNKLYILSDYTSDKLELYSNYLDNLTVLNTSCTNIKTLKTNINQELYSETTDNYLLDKETNKKITSKKFLVSYTINNNDISLDNENIIYYNIDKNNNLYIIKYNDIKNNIFKYEKVGKVKSIDRKIKNENSFYDIQLIDKINIDLGSKKITLK